MAKRRSGTFILLVLLAVAAFLILRWPRLNDVETGRTPEYPDLQVREYAPGEQTVLKAAQKAVESLPRFTFVAAGSGPGGAEIQAVARAPVFKFEDDLTIRIRRQGSRTRVSVRSHSRSLAWDFGQNARNIREFQAALDRQLAGGR